MSSTVSTGGRQLARAWRDPLARAGITARGVLYVILGIMAIQFARGQVGSEEVNQTGAFEQLLEQPFGKFLLVAVVLGLAAMTLWRLIQAFTGDPIEGDEAKDKVEFFGKAVIYGFLTFTAAKITIDNWSSTAASQASQAEGDSQQQQAASTLFDLPAGRWLVAILGVVLIGIALYQFVEDSVKAEFMERLAPPSGAHKAIEGFGRIGYAARSVVLVISGIFFIVAAVQHDPNESKGISGALQTLAQQSWGRIVLWAVAVGFIVFGVYCLAEARYRRHT